MGPPAWERINTQLDTLLGNLLCLSWTGKDQRCLSPASGILAFCDSITLHSFAGEWVKEHRKGNSKSSVVLVVTEILTFNGYFYCKEHLCYILYVIYIYICIVRVLLVGNWHRDYLSEPEKYLGDQLLLVPGGIKHCYVFMGLCSDNLLLHGVFWLWTASSSLVSLLNSLDRIPTVQSFLFLSFYFFSLSFKYMLFMLFNICYVCSKAQDFCSVEAAVEVVY